MELAVVVLDKAQQVMGELVAALDKLVKAEATVGHLVEQQVRLLI